MAKCVQSDTRTHRGMHVRRRMHERVRTNRYVDKDAIATMQSWDLTKMADLSEEAVRAVAITPIINTCMRMCTTRTARMHARTRAHTPPAFARACITASGLQRIEALIGHFGEEFMCELRELKLNAIEQEIIRVPGRWHCSHHRHTDGLK